MRKPLLIVLLFLCFSGVRAQSWVYHPFPTDSATWTIAHGMYNLISCCPPVVEYSQDSSDHYTMTLADTIIGSENYSQLFLNGVYRCGIRDDGGKIWVVPADSLNELLSYDFTVSTGDTMVVWEAVFGQWPLQKNTYYAGMIDSVLINGSYRKQVRLNGGSDWIEGIGNVKGLFREGWPNVSNMWSDLYCMSHRDSTLYPAAAAGACPSYTVVIYNSIAESQKGELKIFPDPATDFLQIEFSQDISLVEICDLAGRVVVDSKEKTKLLKLDVFSLPSGMYIIRVTDTNKNVSCKKFIKQ